MGDRLRCENGEWKTRSQFSKSQLDKYNQRVRAGTSAPNKTGMRCTEHSKQQTLEIQCQGPCNRFRELNLFSRSTRRNGKNWCVDCTDWQIRTENGETLPPPGGILSMEELGPRVPRPAALRDDMINMHGSASNFNDDDESSFLAYDEASDAWPALSGPSLYDTQWASPGSNDDAVPGADLLDSIIPPNMRPDPKARAPHWLIPDLDAPLSDSLASLSVSADTTSIAPSTTTAGPPPQHALRPPVPFNAWGPNGEFARMVKTPTVMSGATSTTNTTRGGRVDRQPKDLNLTRSGWAKVPTRKQPPQLPDYLKYDTPYVSEERGGFDEDSDDGY